MNSFISTSFRKGCFLPKKIEVRKIELALLVSESEYTTEQIAAALWPTNRHAILAYKRVAKGEAVLDANQIVKLSELLGLSIDDLFSKPPWDIEAKKDILVLTKRNSAARIELDLNSKIAKNYESGGLDYKKVVMPGWLTLDEINDIFN